MKVLIVLLFAVAGVFATKKEGSWPVGRECHVDGPGAILDKEINPWMVKTLDELSELSSNLLSRISDGIAYLEPHVDVSPMYELNRTEFFANIQQGMNGNFRAVDEDVQASWQNFTALIDRYEDKFALLENPYACAFVVGSKEGLHQYQRVFEDITGMVAKIRAVQERSSEVLLRTLQELSVTTQALVTNCLGIIMDTLKLRHLNLEDSRRLLLNNLERMAPNFFGALLRKVSEPGIDHKNVKQINKIVLGETQSVHHQMQMYLSELGSRSYPCSEMRGRFLSFWRTQAHGSRSRVQSRPTFHADVNKLYQDDHFLSEVALALMTSFEYDPKEYGKE